MGDEETEREYMTITSQLPKRTKTDVAPRKPSTVTAIYGDASPPNMWVKLWDVVMLQRLE